MYKKVSALTFILVMISLTCFSSFCLASSWYDGLPQEGIDWGISIVLDAKDQYHGGGTVSRTFDGITVTFVLVEGDTGVGTITISDRGSRTYVGDEGAAVALAELRAAVSKEDMASAASSSSIAFTTGESSEDKAPLISSETPIATADRTGLRIIKNVVIPKAKTKEQKQKIAELVSSGKPQLIGGTITYETFDYFDISGKTYEVLSGLEKSFENYSLGVFVPLSYVDVTGGNWTKLGTTGYIKKVFPKENCDLSLGFNVALEQTWMSVDGVENSLSYGAGPMASCSFYLQNIEIGLGSNLLYMGNTEYDTVGILTTGVNIGVPLGNNFIVNLTTYRTDNFDSDSDYWQIGGTASYLVSDIFEVVFVITTVTGLDNFDSNAYHLGGSWRY